jgi:hypothetical protein
MIFLSLWLERIQSRHFPEKYPKNTMHPMT